MLRLARRDFDSLEVMKRSQQVDDAIFGFHAQQAVEKALKAWLSAAGQGYPRVHDLRLLIRLLESGGQDVPQAFRRLVCLTAFAAQFRYDVGEDLQPQLDRPAVIREVAEVVNHVARLIAQPKPAP